MMEFLRREEDSLITADCVDRETARLRALEEMFRVILNLKKCV